MSASGRVLPLPVTNEIYLRAAAKDDWTRVKMAMFAGDPRKQPRASWQGFPAVDMLKASHAHLNTYCSVGLQTGFSRGLAGFEKTFMLVIDDAGTKADLSRAEGFLGRAPNYVLETSPGNHQAGWFTELTDLAWSTGLVKNLYEAMGRQADNLKNLVTYVRLPVGTNWKAELGPAGFRCRMIHWAPGDRSMDWIAIENRIGRAVPVQVSLSRAAGAMPDPGEIEADSVLQAFRLLGMVQSAGRVTTMGWGFDVDCPWIEEHTDRAREGTSYVPVRQRFRCHHGHCQDRTMGDVRARLNALLAEDSGGLTSLAGLDFDAVTDAGAPPAVARSTTAWKAAWQCSGKNGTGPAIANVTNVLVTLRRAPAFAGAFGFNAFTLREMLHRELPGVAPGTTPGVPREWRDQDTVLLQDWLQIQGLRSITTNMVDLAVNTIMHEQIYHPVRDWLEGLRWDGVARLDEWLARYAGTPQDTYHAHVGRWFLMTMCRRVAEPGCRADYMLVLEGPQGIEKSTLLARLAGPVGWFSDSIPDIGTKDASEHLVGRWLIEIAEMDRFDRAESAAMKAFLSRTTERYRRAFARRTMNEPRQCVFAGTVNHRSYLKDDTGNRRYWPITVGRIDLAGLMAVRDQLFAEAWHRAVTLGEQYWPDPLFEDLFIQPEQDERLEADPWDHLVMGFLRDKTRVLIHEVIVACTGGGSMHLSTTNRNRVVRIMETLHWKRGPRGNEGEKFWYPTNGASGWVRSASGG